MSTGVAVTGAAVCDTADGVGCGTIVGTAAGEIVATVPKDGAGVSAAMARVDVAVGAVIAAFVGATVGAAVAAGRSELSDDVAAAGVRVTVGLELGRPVVGAGVAFDDAAGGFEAAPAAGRVVAPLHAAAYATIKVS